MSYETNKLIEAIQAGHLFTVINLLDDGENIELPDVHGAPGLPLRTACFVGNMSIVRELLTRGANVSAPSGEGDSAPLRLALRQKHFDIAALLIQQGAFIPDDVDVDPRVFKIQASPIPGKIGAPVLPESQADAPHSPLPDDHLDLGLDFLSELPKTTASAKAPSSQPLVLDNTIEFTTASFSSDLSTKQPVESEALGTETRLLSADLMFLEEESTPSPSFQTPGEIELVPISDSSSSHSDEESFGTDTRALGADLLFVEEDLAPQEEQKKP